MRNLMIRTYIKLLAANGRLSSECGGSDKMSIIIIMIVILVLVIVGVIFKDDILSWLKFNVDPGYWDIDTPD